MIVSPLDNTKVLNPLSYGTKYSDCPNCKERHLIQWYNVKTTKKYHETIKNGNILCPKNNVIYEVVYDNHWLNKPLDPYIKFDYCKECIHLATNFENWFIDEERPSYSHNLCSKCVEEKDYRNGCFGHWNYFITLEQYKENVKQYKIKEEIKRLKKQIVIPNRYVVQYGEIEVDKEQDESFGYTYFYKDYLNVGDIVQVPQTWLSELKESRGPKLATVVSTKSSYDGPVANIIRIIKRK